MATAGSSPRAQPPPASRQTSSATASSSASLALSHSTPHGSPHRRPRPFERKSSAVSARTLTLRGAAGAAASISGQTREGTALAYGNGYGSMRDGKRMVGSIQLGDGSWEGMDPDEIFRRLTVREAKKVEAKLRNDADNKQGELRTTVGERYRDLLLSTSQITALRANSLRLSTLLSDVAEVCASPAGGAAQVLAGPGTDQTRDGEDEMVEQLPVAAHMKLLLDAPESLYGFLATESYLEAAYLWLLARVVKESLEALATQGSTASAPVPDARTFLPLMQKQWEVLAPFRTQIVRRATASLAYRRSPRADAQERHGAGERLVEALLAIILLDSNTVLDVLGLFFAERTRSLSQILKEGRAARRTDELTARDLANGEVDSPRRSRAESTHQRQRSTKLNAAAMLRGLSPAPPSAGGSADAASVLAKSAPGRPISTGEHTRSARRQRARTTRAFVEMVRCILETLEAVRSLFLPHEEEESGSSPLDDTLRRIQEVPVLRRGLSDSRADGQAHEERPGHKRRRSRLASISMPLTSPDVATSVRRAFVAGGASAVSTGPYLLTVNSQSILRALPSSQILLSFLPVSIQAFAPFIPASAISNGDQSNVILQRLHKWHETALAQLSDSASAWLTDIGDIKDVCAISAAVATSLEELKLEMDWDVAPEEDSLLQDSLRRVWAKRMREIWLDKLAAIEEAMQSEVSSVLKGLGDQPELCAEELASSRLLFGRDLNFPPAPSSTLLLSGPASSAFADIHLPAFRTALRRRRDGRTPLLDRVLTLVEGISESLLQDLRAIPHSLPGWDSLQAEYEVAAASVLERIAAALEGSAHGDTACKTFIGRLAQHLSTGPLASCGSFASQVLAGQSKAFSSRLEAIRVNSLRERHWELVDQSVGQFSETSSNSPSPGISGALQVSLLALARSALEEELIPGKPTRKAAGDLAGNFARRAIDVSCGDAGPEVGSVLITLAGAEGSSSETQTGRALLQRQQLMLNPLLRGLQREGTNSTDRLSILLPLGTPALGTDYSSPLPVAKPAPRFGMLATI